NNVNGNTVSNWLRTPKQGSYTLNYVWKLDSAGSTIKATIDHTYSLKTERNDVRSSYNELSFNRRYRSNTPSNTDINTGQIDLVKTLNKQSAFAAGVKIVSTSRDNSILTERMPINNWLKDSAASDDYRYTEKLLMFYTSYDRTFGKTTVKIGLRGEQTKATGYSVITKETIRRSYFGWFPSVFISRVINAEKGESFNLNYSRRVRRPGYNDLNPYRLQVHDFTILTGNPDLIPQYTHSFRAGYSFWSKLSVGAYLLTTQHYIALTAKAIDSIIEYRSKNFRNSTEYGFFAEHNFTVAKTWNIRSSFSYYRLSNDISGRKYKLNTFNIQNIQVIMLPKLVNIDVVAWYYSPMLQANENQAENFNLDIGFTRTVLKNRGRLRFMMTDI
ncbi:MAG: TonB-dependent receptor, partial [Pedobacter sp.]